jgi:hypothetical protein
VSADGTLVPIREDFAEYEPPRWLVPTVRRLLASLSHGHLHGLAAVVLTNSTLAASRRTAKPPRRRRRRRRSGTLLGRYFPGGSGHEAHIELVVDAIVGQIPRHFDRVQFARDVTVSRTLYHEVGHHLDASIGTRSRDAERSAEAWRRRLQLLHFRRHYLYLKPVARPLAALFRMLARRARSRGR